jgi:hypothetical protein
MTTTNEHLTTLKEMLAEHTRLIDHFKGVGNKKALENLERERDGLTFAIQTLEMSARDQWTATSERLPEDGWYLVMNQESMQVAEMRDGTWYDQSEDDFIDTYVDAWRPLPQPYNPTEENNNG